MLLNSVLDILAFIVCKYTASPGGVFEIIIIIIIKNNNMQQIVWPSISSLQHADSSLHFEKRGTERCKQSSPAARNGAKTSMCHHILTSLHNAS